MLPSLKINLNMSWFHLVSDTRQISLEPERNEFPEIGDRESVFGDLLGAEQPLALVAGKHLE